MTLCKRHPREDIFYRQCKLQKGNRTQVAWIPEKYAKKGKTIKIRTNPHPGGCVVEDPEWEDGWVCHSVGTRLSEDSLHEREFKHHRKRTDI